ncbi:MAG: RNA 2',3'-cyclic phosphodiesterase [Thermodesulfobacteriota bacterium]
MIRCFLAIDLPDSLRPQLALVQGELKKSHADVRWVAVGNIHLTLKFFGNVPDNEIEALTRAAQEVAAQQTPFKLQVTVAGAFPNMKSPRVIWLGLGGDVIPLAQMYHQLEKVFEVLGRLPEGRPFNPHLTLGRVKSPANRHRLAMALEKLPPLNWPPFQVNEIILFKSTLTPQGSIYTPLQVIPLGK